MAITVNKVQHIVDMLGRARSAVEGDMKTEMVAITQMRNEQHVCSSDGRWYAFGRGVAEWPESWLLALIGQAAASQGCHVQGKTSAGADRFRMCKRRALVCIWQRSGGVA